MYVFMKPGKEGTFKGGEIVFAKSDPSLKLIVRRFVDRIYYCRIQIDPLQKERVYFERELTSSGRNVYR